MVTNAQKQHTPTTTDIAKELEKLTTTPTAQLWLTEKLSEAENAGRIKKTTANINDEPTIQRKNQVPNKQPILKRLLAVFQRNTYYTLDICCITGWCYV